MPDTDETLYDALGVPEDAGAEQITRAYRKLAVRLHPDAGGDIAEFQRVTHARDVLADPHRRAQYDADLSTSRSGPALGRPLTARQPQAAATWGGTGGGSHDDPLWFYRSERLDGDARDVAGAAAPGRSARLRAAALVGAASVAAVAGWAALAAT